MRDTTLAYQYNPENGTTGKGYDYEGCSPFLDPDAMNGRICLVARGTW